MSVILRCTNDDGIVQDIQVQDQTDLRLDISAIENTTIGDVFGISSQDFSLVGSDGVNAFFGNVWNLGATPAVALQNSIDCQVLLNGAEVFKGKLYIKNIITDSEGYNVIYNVIVVNETVDFKFEIQDLYLNQLNLSQYDHNFTYANISASWNGGLLGGDIVYPFVNYGRPEGDNDSPDYAFSSFNVTGSNSFDNFDSPLRLTDFKPAIRAKSVVDAIFSGSSYDYTSSFFNSEYFGDLFLLTTANDQLGPNNTSPVSQSAWVYNASGSQTLAANSQALVEFDAEVIDNANNFNLATERYTADTTGNYQYQISINYTIGNYAPSTTDRVTIILRKNGSSIVDSQQYFNPPATGSAFLQNGIQLEPSDYLEVEISFNSNTGTRFLTILNDQGQPSYYPQGYVSYFQVKGPASLLGGTIEMAEQFPDDLKALDFLQGLIEKFNLVVEPVPSSRNLISIEPYQTWIDSGKQIDWTNKVDRDVNFEIVHPILEQPRTIVFKDEDDTDVLNKYTLDNLGKTFGSYKFVSDSDLAEGERVVGKVFAATPVTGIPNGRTFVVPHLCTATDNREFRPLKFKPRLLYNNGVQNVPDTAFGISGSVSTRGQIYIRDENSDTQTSTTWNQMSTLTAIPVNYSTGQDLHFNNDQYSQYFQASANGKVKADAFRTYWATYINSLYDIDARKLTCNVYLKPTEIQDIALNDKIFIDGAYYRINRVNGANLSRRDTIEVELIKIIAQQLKFPKRRVGTTNLVLDYNSLSINGTGLYVDLDTGAVVNNFDTIRAVAAKDYMQIYNNAGTASVVWDYQVEIDNTNQFDQSVLGTNKVDIGASKVSALGSGNQVKAGTETSFIVGNQNFVGENTTNVTIFGQNHSVDDQAQNAQILGGAFNSISGSNQSTIMGSSGSTIVNSDSSISINGTNDTILQSDFTTAINNHENEVIVNGSGHAVIGLNREGAGLDLLNTRNNSNFLGDTYIGGGYLVDSFTKNVGDSTTTTLTGSSYGNGKHETLYLLNWNGLSPGTASINLPSAANSDYKKVVYTFKLTSGNAGEVVRIIPFDPAQTIDGATSYSTSGSYAFVSIHASGSKWHVIDSSAGTQGPPGPSGSTFPFTGSAIITGSLTVTGSITATSGFTGSLLGTASFAISSSFASTASFTPNALVTASVSSNTITFTKGNGTTFPITVSTGSFSAFPFTGSAAITGSLIVTGSTIGNVVSMSIVNQTASMDLSKGNAFSITLTTSSVTLITASNIIPNQRISLLVNQNSPEVFYFGNLFFEPSQFVFPYVPLPGLSYVTSTASGSKDILTFETFTFNPNVIANTGIQYSLVSASIAPPSIVPTSVPTLKAWWDGQVGVITSGSRVTQWLDSSGMNNTASQATAARRPIYSQSIAAIKNNNAIDFEASNVEYLSYLNPLFQDRPGYMSVDNEATVFVVSSIESAPSGSYGAYVSEGYGVNESVAVTPHKPGTPDNELNYATNNGTPSNIGGRVISSNQTGSIGEWYTTTYQWTQWINRNTHQIYVNSVLATSSIYGNDVSLLYNDNKNIGNFIDQTSASNIDGMVAEIIVYTSSLSDADRQGVENYLRFKYGHF